MNKLVLAGFLLFFAVACHHRRSSAIGGDDQIIVFADSSEWRSCGASLRAVLERIIRTPQPETEFYIQHEPMAVFNSYEKYKYIVLLGVLDSKGDVSRTIQGLLAADAEKAVRSGEYFYFIKENEWAEGQTVILLFSKDTSTMNQALYGRGGEIFQIVDTHKTELVSGLLYGSVPGNVNFDKEFFQKNGWQMRMLPDYKIVDTRPDYVRWHTGAASSQRWISVYWKPCRSRREADSVITHRWMTDMRSLLGHWFADPEVTDTSFNAFYETCFNDIPVSVYQGLWKTPSLENAFGGPFRAYAFYDALSHRIFFMDTSVFCPEEDKKLKFLRELNVIVNSFTSQRPT
jgi:hypothetical protein